MWLGLNLGPSILDLKDLRLRGCVGEIGESAPTSRKKKFQIRDLRARTQKQESKLPLPGCLRSVLPSSGLSHATHSAGPCYQ